MRGLGWVMEYYVVMMVGDVGGDSSGSDVDRW